MRRRAAAAGVLAVVVASAGLAGCAHQGVPRQQPPEPVPEPTQAGTSSPSSSPSPSPSSSPSSSSSSSPAPSPGGGPRYSAWVLGSRELALRPDGYGVAEPTPPSLRRRRYPTTDLLPQPSDGRFHGTVGALTEAVLRRMGDTYRAGCPVPPSGLRYLTVTFRGFDGAAHTGELVVARSQARGIVSVFRSLFRADFPIEEMRLPTTADLEAHPTGDGNNTAAFVCRPSTGQTGGFSAHALGLAIDVDPFMNPYLKGDLVLPELASSYLDRDRVRPGMVEPDDVVVRAFAAIGWSWGGEWRTLKDYQHFTATGR